MIQVGASLDGGESPSNYEIPSSCRAKIGNKNQVSVTKWAIFTAFEGQACCHSSSSELEMTPLDLEKLIYRRAGKPLTPGYNIAVQ